MPYNLDNLHEIVEKCWNQGDEAKWIRAPARKTERNSQQFSFLGSEGVKRIQDASCYRLRLWWETSVQVRDKTPKHT